jgi:hypothetical protein
MDSSLMKGPVDSAVFVKELALPGMVCGLFLRYVARNRDEMRQNHRQRRAKLRHFDV